MSESEDLEHVIDLWCGDSWSNCVDRQCGGEGPVSD